MKKCPFCEAAIEDHARFCLYCMKPLIDKEVILPPQKKKQWWLPVAAGGLLLALLLLILLLPGKPTAPQEDSAHNETTLPVQTTEADIGESTDPATQDTQGATDDPPENTDTDNTQQDSERTDADKTPERPPADVTPEPSDSEGSAPAPIVSPTPTTPTTPTTPILEETTAPSTPIPEETTEPSAAPEETPPQPTEPEAPKAEVVYTYRAARAGDDFNANYSNSGNDIVITGISCQSANGVYDIPAYIDGKQVIAIVANAFYGSNAKVVYIPSTLRTIWNYAFHGCALTDIYFTHNIYIEGNAFGDTTGKLTIHCPANCQDRNFRYYKNSAANYGATWEEWNGL